VAEGPVELLQMGYNAGFGERTAQGFGMVHYLGPAEGLVLESGGS